MDELIAKLEAAPERRFELGAEVLCRSKGYRFLSVEPRATMGTPYRMMVCAEAGMDGPFEFSADDPTQSFDAAMALRDRDRLPILVLQEAGILSSFARLAVFNTAEGAIEPVMFDGEAKTLQLALCIAAIKSGKVI